MYAIILDGRRQLKVEEGQEIEIDFRDATAGDKITFDRVLALGGDKPQLGSPAISGASVTCEVLGAAQGPKLVVQAMRRRKNSRRKNGHRQLYTRVKVSKIATS